MAKQKIMYRCTKCDYRPLKWLGCCSQCQEWNSISEIKMEATLPDSSVTLATIKKINEISTTTDTRIISGIDEWDRVVGGGIVPGSFLILTGDPGIGKSTLLLTIAHHLSQTHKIIYFCTEESLQQVKQRAIRLECGTSQLLFSDCAHIESIIATIEYEQPTIVIIDSIQNCSFTQSKTVPGTTSQLRESSHAFMNVAKKNHIAIILSGHITKDGTIAGPKLLEHMVDAVFYLQGEDPYQTRMLRSVKNRFGPVNELGFFQMTQTGLAQMTNINEYLLSDTIENPGSARISYVEGSRPLLLELQALTVKTGYGIPQRVVTGLDHKQVVLIAAILEKHLRIRFNEHDIFFKVGGGFKLRQSCVDLGIACALLSSFYQQALPEKSIVLGEMSLTGAIKPIPQLNIHIKEAEKFGIKHIIVAEQQKIETSCQVRRFKNVYELLELFNTTT